jgi:hypothetical protein
MTTAVRAHTLAVILLHSLAMRSLLPFVVLAACTSTSSDVTGPFPDDTSVVNLTIVGGLAPMPGPGSTCQPADDSFTYSLSDRHLGWSSCESPTTGGTYAFVTGSKTLSDSDHDALVSALRALKLPPGGCGGDTTETFEFATPHGTSTFPEGGCMPGATDVIDLFYTAEN